MRIYILIVILATISANSQEKENNLKLHSINTGFGGFYLEKTNYDEGIEIEGGGPSIFANLVASIDQNLISTTYLTGSLFGEGFKELSIQYGREIKIQKWLSFELFAGLGYYNVNFIENKKNSISYPLKFNTIFNTNEKFGIGINSNYSINEIANNLSINFLFQYKIN